MCIQGYLKEVTMIASGLFDWLVQYHVTQNLTVCYPHLHQGKVFTKEGKPHREGEEENEWYTGILIVANGSTLYDRLFADKVVLDGEMDPAVRVENVDGLATYLSEQHNGDGAYVFNGQTQEIRRVYELNNNPASLSQDVWLEEVLPSDFCADNGSVSVRRNSGTKTRLAAKLPRAYEDCHTFQIKRTAYTPLGVGKVTHFTKQGLLEEFFFRYAPHAEGPFIDEARGIVGVYRRYGRDDGGELVRLEEQLVTPPLIRTVQRAA